ncbi:response regulator [Bdellovibrionota bacterium]
MAKGRETILLVEDEKLVREMLKFSLEEKGYRVLSAANGDEALQILDDLDGEIPLLVTDLVLPGMGGEEVASKVIKSSPNTKILYMSGFSEITRTKDALRPRGEFLPKPITPQIIVEKVREVLDKGSK